VNGRSLAEQAGLSLEDVRVTVRDWVSACVLVREGLGVALVPESTLPQNQQGIRAIPLNPAISREFGVVCSKAGYTSEPVQALLKGLI
jgi:DNA-binding transcriptional LysR family regulator